MTSRWRIVVATIAVAAIAGWSCSLFSPSPSCSYDEAISATHCGCSFEASFDLTSAAGVVELWPFGVHSQSGHTEGHRGLDTITTSHTVELRSPVDGKIRSIDNSQDSSGGSTAEYGTNPALHFTTIDADCGLQVKMIPVLLDAGFRKGSRVTKGQRLGDLPQMIPPYGPNRWSSHFEIEAKKSSTDPALASVCPADLFPASQVVILNALLAASHYDEKVARTVPIACENGTTLNMSFPAEDRLCNARLDTASRNLLAACTPSKASQIW